MTATPGHAAGPASVAPPRAPAGLTSAEARARLARDGPNRLVPEPRGRRLKRLAGPLADPMVALLLVAAPTYLLIGDTADAIVAFAALGPIAAVGWLLESRAERTLDRLRRMTAPVATVWRDGARRQVPADDLVVDDLVVLHQGDVVPADARVVELTQLTLDESALTGESLPVAKTVGEAGTGSGEREGHGGVGGGDRGGRDGGTVWAGTTVVSGRALVRVFATGTSTRYGRIGTLVAAVRQPPTPLQRGLARLVRTLALLAGLLCVAVVGAVLLHGDGWGDAVIAGVSLAIAAIPEEFSMVYTLYLALGAWRLAQQRALVRRLPSVETLGSTTVICADKTGTLTHGRLAVAGLWAVAGDERELLETAVLACEPSPYDPLDVAIVDHARDRGVDVAALHAGDLVTDWPFDPVGRYLTHVWRPAGAAGAPGPAGVVVAAKGSIEGLLAPGAGPDRDHADSWAAHDAFAADGMRVVAVARATAPGPTGDRRRDEAGLHLVGLVAFNDPIREGVAEALAECRTAGIRVVMVTGDHPATAHAVAEGLDLPHDVGGRDVIATGADLDEADPDRVQQLAATANVFARTRPEQKHQLVQALRGRGEVVAMTGDGINDAPALREADIGVAMGRRGTEVARAAATLVLVDDNFATIVRAVRDGRRIFDNLTRAFAYLIAFHPPLLLGALVVPLLDRPLLLLPVHLVMLELLLHPVVSLVFQAEPADADVMDRPPRPVGDALRLRAMWRAYAVGGVLALGVVVAYLAALGVGWPVEEARGLGFVTLLASQPLLLLGMRSPDRPLWRSGRPWTRTLGVVLAVLGVVAVAAVAFPPLAGLLKVAPFPPVGWLVAGAVAVATTVWSEPLKRRS
ncbi:MAG TPA: cation-translocating P-type ATPase [Acidimicrobiales bacterium]|nr:cation-translocating P-type ATPase [Acidimicrobiales bacterium]